MLARSSIIRHPSGTTLTTPLLVPSFSSKGLLRRSDGKSELLEIFANTAEVLTESMLVSAYDIHYGHLPKPNRFPCTPSLTFVDSGGYETNSDFDLSAAYRYGAPTKKWRLSDYRSILDRWPAHVPAVFVSFDKDAVQRPLVHQIAEARALARKYPQHLSTLLIKPIRGSQHRLTNMLHEIRKHAKALATFSIIAVTEKDLGSATLERMTTLAKLRQLLDGEGIRAPVHVFGALDPIASPLYLLSGAEIFDGLTWLRFAYHGPQCLYQQNYAFLKIGIDASDDFVKSKILSDNYAYLRDLQLAMRRFASTPDFSHFGQYSDLFARAADSLQASLSGAH
jgi:hypothetical protein